MKHTEKTHKKNKKKQQKIQKKTTKKNVMGQWQSEACSQHNLMLETQTAFVLHMK